jgi:hypothetical protein
VIGALSTGRRLWGMRHRPLFGDASFGSKQQRL